MKQINFQFSGMPFSITWGLLPTQLKWVDRTKIKLMEWNNFNKHENTKNIAPCLFNSHYRLQYFTSFNSYSLNSDLGQSVYKLIVRSSCIFINSHS